nr:soluble starch synthase 1, chloroplastic/amyloplastic [Tanacetum cinerariifolium]
MAALIHQRLREHVVQPDEQKHQFSEGEKRLISLLAAKYRPHGIYKDAWSIALIHNLSRQGVDPAATYENLGLPYEWHGALEWVFPTQGYSWEITTPKGGHGMNELLTSRKSIVNRITKGKIECKIALQKKKIGLPVRPDCPLVGYQGLIKDLDKSLADELDSFDALIFRKCLLWSVLESVVIIKLDLFMHQEYV